MTGRKRPDHAIAIHHRVGFHECDPLGVVWHGRYAEWFEAARNALFISFGLDIPDIQRLGHRMFIVEARCRFMVPLTYGDVAVVHAWFGDVSPLIHVRYDVVNEAGDRWCARAATTLATTDGDGRLLVETPRVIRERLPVRASG